MGTTGALHGCGNRASHLLKPFWDGDYFAGQRVKRRHYRAGSALVLSRQVQLQSPVNAAKQDFCLQRRSLAVADCAGADAA